MSRRARQDASPALALVVQLFALAAGCAALAGALVLAGAQFGSPAWLHLAWAGPVILVLDALAAARRRRARRLMGDPGAIARLVEGRARFVRSIRALLGALAVSALAVACARPQWGQAEEELVRRGVDVFILLDTSRSMLAEDVKPSRLERAKLALDSMVDRLEGDRIALVPFAGDARIACPLTTDRGAVKMFLDLLEADVLQRPGTAIADALTLVAQSVPEDSGRSVAIVLITDGEDHEGGMDDAIERLKERGIVVHAVGIGSTQGAPVPADGNGAGFMRDENGQPVMSRLGLESLEQVTSRTGGVLAQATGREIELAAIAGAIGSMSQQDISSRQARIRPDHQQPFLALAFALLLAELALPDGAPLARRRAVTRTERVAAAAAARRSARVAGPKAHEDAA